jgi:NitT/TauT family transport system substrate-binding protein
VGYVCKGLLLVFALCLSASIARPAMAQEAPELRMGIQFGLTYLPFAVMEHERLIEKHAQAGGLPNLKVTWFRSAGGPTLNDGLLSGTLDMAATGVSGFLTLWDKARGRFDIKGIASYGHTTLALVTRNPNVRSIRDFTEKDRIALPAIKTSIQAIMLQMAAEKEFGAGNAAKLDALTISRSHPDAMAALLSNTEITSHFAGPPYLFEELKQPGIRQVLASEELFGGPVSNGVLYTTERFRRDNPRKYEAVWAALREAVTLVQKEPRRAAEIYLAVAKETTKIDGILEILNAPTTRYDEVPRSVLQVAQFMKRMGSISQAPASWKELFFPEAHALPGS